MSKNNFFQEFSFLDTFLLTRFRNSCNNAGKLEFVNTKSEVLENANRSIRRIRNELSSCAKCNSAIGAGRVCTCAD